MYSHTLAISFAVMMCRIFIGEGGEGGRRRRGEGGEWGGGGGEKVGREKGGGGGGKWGGRRGGGVITEARNTCTNIQYMYTHQIKIMLQLHTVTQ